MVERTNMAEETISKVLSKLNTSGEETKVLCSNVDEIQQRKIIQDWLSQTIVSIVTELSDYPL
jgi:hypothetical protein